MSKESLKIYGLIGYPVKHSLSPIMHNFLFKFYGFKAEYRLFEVKPEDLRDFLISPDREFKDTEGNLVRAADVAGFNITIPHKVSALQFFKENRLLKNVTVQTNIQVDIIGAINTVTRSKGKIVYNNTDCEGFRRSLTEDLKFDPKDKNVLIFGCGGAGRAVVVGLNIKPAVKTIYIYEKNLETVKSVKEHLDIYKSQLCEYKFISEQDIPQVVKKCQLLVNASPIGMKDTDPPVINKSLLHKDLAVYDVVYNRETQLIKDAKELALPVAGGLGMLLYQGVAAWQLWTGKKADDKIIRIIWKALEEEIKGEQKNV
ncbi:MAG: shikimate dehydrogenase [Candidatus Omnitrophica bacterium]|jgi:shikimate dehydrogenase|nr:shikimate dehydrogenase [Candidatus Omnitrophota bacterium]